MYIVLLVHCALCIMIFMKKKIFTIIKLRSLTMILYKERNGRNGNDNDNFSRTRNTDFAQNKEKNPQ